MTEQIRGLCSMATKGLLVDLSDGLRRRRSLSVRFESAGGKEVAGRIREGAEADLAVLDEDAMVDLDADGFFRHDTLRPLFVSDVVAAVPRGAASTPFSTEEHLRAALVNAHRIGYSTGPSGTALLLLIERWCLNEVVANRLVQAPPGVSVASLLIHGQADIGFQQRSEMSGLDGIRVLGPLPGAAAIRSKFSGAVLTRSKNTEPASEVLRFLSSRDAEERVMAAGMMLRRIN